MAYLLRFEIQGVAYFQEAGPIFGEMNSYSRILTQIAEAIKPFIAGGTIPIVGDLRIRRFTSTPFIALADVSFYLSMLVKRRHFLDPTMKLTFYKIDVLQTTTTMEAMQ